MVRGEEQDAGEPKEEEERGDGLFGHLPGVQTLLLVFEGTLTSASSSLLLRTLPLSALQNGMCGLRGDIMWFEEVLSRILGMLRSGSLLHRVGGDGAGRRVHCVRATTGGSCSQLASPQSDNSGGPAGVLLPHSFYISVYCTIIRKLLQPIVL